MNRLAARALILSLLFASSDAFSPVQHLSRHGTAVFDTAPSSNVEAPLEDATPALENAEVPAAKPLAPKKQPAKKDAEGIFAPAVLLTKDIVGAPKLNKLRGKIIGMHSEVIGKFTETAQTEFGNQVLKVLFTLADKNGDGTIDEEELNDALKALGFDFLKEKQVAGIFERADGDKNGRLDFDEWQQAAPKTLRTALIKLAKKNGHDLGFLA